MYICSSAASSSSSSSSNLQITLFAQHAQGAAAARAWQQQHHWRSPRLSGNRKGQKQFLAVNKQNSQTIAIVLFVGVQQPRRLRS